MCSCVFIVTSATSRVTEKILVYVTTVDTYCSSQVEYYNFVRHLVNIPSISRVFWYPAATEMQDAVVHRLSKYSSEWLISTITFPSLHCSFLSLAFTPYSDSPLRKLLNILDKCWETELTTLIQKILQNIQY